MDVTTTTHTHKEEEEEEEKKQNKTKKQQQQKRNKTNKTTPLWTSQRLQVKTNRLDFLVQQWLPERILIFLKALLKREVNAHLKTSRVCAF